MQTYKLHQKLRLSRSHPFFPITLQDTSIKQVSNTINLLRKSRPISSLSAYAHIVVYFNCDATPLAPLESKCIVHEKTEARVTWDIHVVNTYCASRAMKHFRCYKVHAEKNFIQNNFRHCDVLASQPYYVCCHQQERSTSQCSRPYLFAKKTTLSPPFEEHKDPTLHAIDIIAKLFSIVKDPNVGVALKNTCEVPRVQNTSNNKLSGCTSPTKLTNLHYHKPKNNVNHQQYHYITPQEILIDMLFTTKQHLQTYIVMHY